MSLTHRFGENEGLKTPQESLDDKLEHFFEVRFDKEKAGKALFEALEMMKYCKALDSNETQHEYNVLNYMSRTDRLDNTKLSMFYHKMTENILYGVKK